MARLQTGDLDFSRGGNDPAGSAVASDRAVGFRFVVTLKCLSIPLDSSQQPLEASPATAPMERPRPAPIALAPYAPPSTAGISVVVTPPPTITESRAPSPAPDAADPAPIANPAGQPQPLPWELAAPPFRLDSVLPTVLRAFKKPASEAAPENPSIPGRDAAPAPAPTPNRTSPVAPAESSPSTESQTLTKEALRAEPQLFSVSRPAQNWKLYAGAGGAVAVLLIAWRLATPAAPHASETAPTKPQPAASAEAPTTTQSSDWVRQAAVGGDPGVKQARQLVLYKPGRTATNSRMEFTWSTDSGEVGLVFRAKDLGNYYAVRLKVLNPRTAPTLDVEYFSVYQFVESQHTEKFLMFSKGNAALRVRLEVVGPAFTLYLQDNATEYWSDARLTSGALGFFEESNRAAQVNAVRISLGQQSGLRLKSTERPLFSSETKKPLFWAREESMVSGGS